MKTKKIIIIICFFFLTNVSSFSEELQFDASNMDIKNEGNSITAYNSKIKLSNQQIFISSKKANYDKLLNFLKFENNVYLEDKVKKIIIERVNINIIYFQNIQLTNSYQILKGNIK